jgi:hypothetical protein
VKPALLRVAVMLEITGSVALIRILRLGAGEGVISCAKASSCVVIVMVPATVEIDHDAESSGPDCVAAKIR